jgi:uncharacterized repeat protein (TIGR01451 family)
VVTYTVVVTNAAQGLATGVALSDSLSPYYSWGVNSYGVNVPFQFTNVPASGLTLGTPLFSRDKGATWTYIPVSGGGGAPPGYDANVTNWQIPTSGTMNANGANFTINYTVMIK